MSTPLALGYSDLHASSKGLELLVGFTDFDPKAVWVIESSE